MKTSISAKREEDSPLIHQVTCVNLPVDEQMRIQKVRIMPEHTGPHTPRICVVTGTHGDELEGQYVCYELARRLREHPELLTGIVDIYPALNPLGIDSITRGVPGFDLDMNRVFPGSEDGAPAPDAPSGGEEALTADASDSGAQDAVSDGASGDKTVKTTEDLIAEQQRAEQQDAGQQAAATAGSGATASGLQPPIHLVA